MMPDIVFHMTSTSVFPPLGIINPVFQVHGAASYTPLKDARMMATTFYQ